MKYYIETTHGILVEVVNHISMVRPLLKEMNSRGALQKRVYFLEDGKKKYLKLKGV